ncbi:uncharacterized protein JN550_006619 [Neoarthrinium moseri]|uniref:uncharacterized protein n=1 Tax=Neoarthrinium moseri TaxID=1658444 RepID=UPI001FDC7273|nr:uncharacterized protein JN550_006619 [Neoarthrinium moseri]KAI1868131.1 hypothetical protein JN550_006619 [Neoarthrinium moseri]
MAPRPIRFRFLVDKLPKAGLIPHDLSKRVAVTSPQMDQWISRNFKFNHEIPYKEIAQRLIQPQTHARRHEAWQTADDFLMEVQGCNKWSATLPFPIFKQLFCRLLGAQQRWNNNKREPYNRDEHSWLAFVVRLFRQHADTYPENDDTDQDLESYFLNDIEWLTDRHVPTITAE